MKCGCAGPRGATGPRGPAGPPGSGVPCVSGDPGNVAQLGEDGCVFVPPGAVAMEGSPCIGISGDGSAGAPFTPAPVINPAACNGLTCTATGLLVPETRVVGDVGPAPGRIASDLQSVDVVVTPPAAGACPQTYTVAAYLSPLRDTVTNVPTVNLEGTRTNPAAWASTGLALVLPDPGVYLIVGDIRTNVCATVDFVGTTNLWTTIRLLHVQSGAAELGGPRIGAQHQYSTSPQTRFQACHNQTTPLSGLVTVTAAQATKTVRVQARLNGDFGGGSTLDASNFDGANSHLTFVKIAD